MNRMIGAVVGALALAGCSTTETIAYAPPASGPTATVILSREYLVKEWDSRIFIAEPGGAVRWQPGDPVRYEYNRPFTVAAEQPIILEVEYGEPDTSENYVIASSFYAFTPKAGATYLVRPRKVGIRADGSLALPFEQKDTVVDMATDKSPPDLSHPLMP
jgi:hypothetical protein